MAVLPLDKIKRGESGLICEIRGGYGFIRRMDAMNIRPGKRITKVSSMFRRGPITIQVDHTQLALGFGMATRILVEVQGR